MQRQRYEDMVRMLLGQQQSHRSLQEANLGQQSQRSFQGALNMSGSTSTTNTVSAAKTGFLTILETQGPDIKMLDEMGSLEYLKQRHRTWTNGVRIP